MVQDGPLPYSALVTFDAVARHLRFARAAAELGVSPTAVSKAVAQLEEQLGVRLLNRTTRSVSLTEAGHRLLASTGPALSALKAGFEETRSAGEAPTGTLRVSLSYVAWATLFAPHLAGFTAAWPRVTVDFTIDSAPEDIVARAFDAGVRPGRALQPEMVALPIGPVQRLIVVGSPAYLERAGRPASPSELVGHTAVRQRLGDERFLEWRLRRGKERFEVPVSGPLVVDDMRAALDAARHGVGLAYVFEAFAGPDLASGALEVVLPDHALVREAFYLYFPSRRHLAPKLRVFADWFQAANR